jgi:hypothetical protein
MRTVPFTDRSGGARWFGAARTAGILLVAAGLLAGCSEARQAMGLGKRAPDEFTVVKRAPLSLPPQYSLRPPEPGAPRPQEPSPTEQARQQVLGGGQGTGAGAGQQQGVVAALGGGRPFSQSGFALGGAALGSSADRSVSAAAPTTPGVQNFRQQLGLNQADPDIRAKINSEHTQLAEADRRLLDNLLFWKRAEEPNAVVVDPAAERKRLQENAALGAAPNSGEVPTIERKRQGVRLF